MANITVSNAVELNAALKAAQGGDAILLQAGSYDGLAVKDLSFADNVTITSADATHQATLSNFNITNVHGLTVSSVEMVASGGLNGFAFTTTDSSGIHFDQVNVHGSLDGASENDPNGLTFRDSSDISITNSEFQQLGRAVAVSSGSDITLTGNSVHDVRTDGFDFAQVSHVQISGNTFKDFRPATGDHPDAIQFWTKGTTTASHDIVISDNLIMRGEGATAQGIFMGWQVDTPRYENITISNNVIVGTGYSALRVGGAKHLIISDNQLVTEVDGYKTFMLVQNSDDVTSTGNEAISIGFDHVTNLTQSGDVLNSAVDDLSPLVQQWLDAHIGTDLGAISDPIAVTPHDPVVLAPTAPEAVVTAPEPVVVAPDPSDSHASAGAGMDVTLEAGRQDLDATGDSLDNHITGNAGDNVLLGLDGADTLSGLGGSDTLAGGHGDDTYILPNSQAQVVEGLDSGVDTVIAKGNYTLTDNVENLQIDTTRTNGWAGTGNGLANEITGNAGANHLSGMAGADTLDGGAGRDIVEGGVGDDRLSGGTGADAFRFGPHSGHDVIADFGLGGERDTIDILAYSKAGLHATLTDVGSDLVISFTTGDTITVQGVHAADLSSCYGGWAF